MKCPFCKEEIQEGAIKCKHCGEILNKLSYTNESEQSGSEPAVSTKTMTLKLNSRYFRVSTWFKLLGAIGLLFAVFNVPYIMTDYTPEYATSGSPPFPTSSYVLNIGPISIQWMHEKGMLEYANGRTWFHLLHTPALGVGTQNGVDVNHRTQYAIAWLPIGGIMALGVFVALWWKMVSRGKPNQNRQDNNIKPVTLKVPTLRFDVKRLGLGEKIILGSMTVAFASLFLPWLSLGMFNVSGWTHKGYLYCLLFVYPVIGVFNTKGFNRIAGIVCGVLALGIAIFYIADKHYNLDGVTGNASGSGLYLFAASTVGLIVGAVKYKRHT